MKTYKITGKTNGYIANRDINFKGNTYVTLVEGLTLREAQEKLLDMFNEDKNTNFKNWGLARCNYPWETSSFKDGTRSYEEDSRFYSIEEEIDEVF